MYLSQRVLRVQPDIVQHRYLLGERLARELDYRVSRGPFEGLGLDPLSWWSGGDRGAILLGLYEREVLDILEELADGESSFVAVGAADGYYAVGMLLTGRCPQAICFEMSDDGRRCITANARLNAVDSQIMVRGRAEAGFLDEIPAEVWSSSEGALFLFDVEGAEFSLLDECVLRRPSTLL